MPNRDPRGLTPAIRKNNNLLLGPINQQLEALNARVFSEAGLEPIRQDFKGLMEAFESDPGDRLS